MRILQTQHSTYYGSVILNPNFMHSVHVSVDILYKAASIQGIRSAYCVRPTLLVARFAASYPSSILLTSMKLGVGYLTGANNRPTVEHSKDPLNLYSALSSTRADFSSHHGRIATPIGAQVPDAMPSR